MTNTEQKELNILDIPVDQVQLRNGWKVEGIFEQGAIIYVVARDSIGTIQAGHRKNNGMTFNHLTDDLDIILKPKKKEKIAPFIFRNSEGFPELMPVYLTEEKAKTWCTVKANFIKWLGDTPLAIEVDEE